jgi:hypothetical protein
MASKHSNTTQKKKSQRRKARSLGIETATAPAIESAAPAAAPDEQLTTEMPAPAIESAPDEQSADDDNADSEGVCVKDGLQDQAKHERALAAYADLMDALAERKYIIQLRKQATQLQERIKDRCHRSWLLWTTSVGPAYVDLHQEAVRKTNRHSGKTYNTEFSRLLKEYKLDKLDHTTRGDLLWVMRHLAEIEELRGGDDEKVNHPTTARRHWGTKMKDDDTTGAGQGDEHKEGDGSGAGRARTTTRVRIPRAPSRAAMKARAPAKVKARAPVNRATTPQAPAKVAKATDRTARTKARAPAKVKVRPRRSVRPRKLRRPRSIARSRRSVRPKLRGRRPRAPARILGPVPNAKPSPSGI